MNIKDQLRDYILNEFGQEHEITTLAHDAAQSLTKTRGSVAQVNSALAELRGHTERQTEVPGRASAPIHAAGNDDAARRCRQEGLANLGLLFVLLMSSCGRVKNPLQLRRILGQAVTPWGKERMDFTSGTK